MTSTPIHDELTVAYELRVLDALLDDECRCDVQHESWDVECSVEVVALAICNCGIEKACQSGADAIQIGMMTEPWRPCADCGQVAAAWRIIPV